MAYLLNKAGSELNEGVKNTEGVEAFKAFEDRLLAQLIDGHDPAKTIEYLNGAAASAVRELVSLDRRRKDGIFFTGHSLAERLVDYVSQQFAGGASAFDPTCGAGDLLLAAMKAMNLSNVPSGTVTELASRIKGFDLHQSFIRSAKLRALLMVSLTGKELSSEALDLLPGLLVADSLTCDWALDGNECVLLNPPFGQVIAPSDITWAGGRVQRAALFIDKALKEMHPSQHGVAILPDVLRSGSNYAKWRSHVARFAKVHAVESIGKFDASTDVDVFILHFERSAEQHFWPVSQEFNANEPCVGDLFDVRTGPLVAYREPNLGPWRAYLDCLNAIPGAEISPTKKRRFRGTALNGPFVVIRRTSSPRDGSRTIATLVNSTDSIAVENHLIVITPKDGRVESCRELLTYFQDDFPTNWLNNRIRCRHLTVSAVRSIPLNWRKRDKR